jgi:hypothetical protein
MELLGDATGELGAAGYGAGVARQGAGKRGYGNVVQSRGLALVCGATEKRTKE